MVFKIKQSNPPRFALYDTNTDLEESKNRILAVHPEFEYAGVQKVIGRDSAKQLAHSFNRCMHTYFEFLNEYK